VIYRDLVAMALVAFIMEFFGLYLLACIGDALLRIEKLLRERKR
jgi:hypothetical protein